MACKVGLADLRVWSTQIQLRMLQLDERIVSCDLMNHLEHKDATAKTEYVTRTCMAWLRSCMPPKTHAIC